MTTSQTIVITGASDGIGAAAARRIRATLPDTDLVLVGRNPAKTKAVATEVGSPFHVADFSRLDEVRDLAAELLTLPRIDVLANNAGGIFDGPSRTTDGFELTWQVNYLAPYLLTNLLRQTLLDSRASVVGTSSIASVLFSRFDPTDPETFDAFSPNRAYGNAKLATNWFAKALHDRFHDRGLSTVAFHPGVIATNFGAESSGILHHAYNLAGDRMFTPAEQGGMNLAYFLTGVPGIHWESGEYYNDKRRPGIQRRAARDRDLIDSVFTETAEVLGVQW